MTKPQTTLKLRNLKNGHFGVFSLFQSPYGDPSEFVEEIKNPYHFNQPGCVGHHLAKFQVYSFYDLEMGQIGKKYGSQNLFQPILND